MLKLIVSIIFIISFYGVPFGFGLDLGTGNSVLKFNSSSQEYTTSSGTTNFQPIIKSTGKGTRQHMGLIFDYWGLEYGTARIKYDVGIPAKVFNTTKDQAGEGIVTIKNFGANIHLRREIGGLSAGLGFSSASDKITVNDSKVSTETFENDSSAFYYKYGIDLLFGAFAFQVNTIVTKVGNHNVRLNSLELMLAF